jgi:hypothetical protein
MDLPEWLLVISIACLFGFFVLRPDNFGRKRGSDDSGGSGHYRHGDDDNNPDGDGTGGADGDGGGGDGGGGD